MGHCSNSEASGTFSTMKVLVFSAAFLSVVLAGCGDSTDSQLTQLQAKSCGGSEPEGVCNAITECVWTGENTSACLQICESTEQDCNEGEKCRRRLLRTSAGRFESTFVCFPEVEPADTPEEQESRTAFCAARPLESCMRARECSAMVATTLFIEDECRQLVPTDCLPDFGPQEEGQPFGQICLPSSYFATRDDFPGDIFYFGSICNESELGFEGFYPQPDDPLYDIIYFESSAWPRCFCSVDC